MRILFLTTSLLYLCLAGFRLVHDGMFLDGITYATIARNMAEGFGSFWQPAFSESLFSRFYEHPPLALGLQAVFFYVFGDHFWVERLYCALVLLITLVLLRAIWRALHWADVALQAWWPLVAIIWMLNEDVYLSYTGNMLECTMGAFALGAVWVLLRRPANWMALPVAALLTILGMLCKGPAGAYPAAFFGVVYLVYRAPNLGRGILNTIAFLGFAATFLGLLLLYEPARLNLLQYLDTQVLAALKGKRLENIAPHRLYILQRIVETNIHLVLLTAGCAWLGWRRNKLPFSPGVRQAAYFCVGMALTALLPIAVSAKQAAHYTVPGTPWIALALACVAAPALQRFFATRQSPVWIVPLLIALHLALLGYMGYQFDKPLSRSKAEVEDVRYIIQRIPPHTHVGILSENGQYNTVMLLYRYGKINSEAPRPDLPWILARQGEAPVEVLKGFDKQDWPTAYWEVHKNKAF